MKLIALVLTLGLSGYVFLSRSEARVDGEEARTLVAAGARLVDVRTRAEFDAGHIPGAEHVPVHNLPDGLGGNADRTRAVIVYCHSGSRSATARRILLKAGFSEVYDLGAISDW